jgi:transcription elongation GreA/GreB family factor
MGKKDGDSVTIEVPSGKKRFDVLEVKTIHDK